MANDAFVKVDKAVVKSQLVGFFIDGLYHDLLCMKVKRKKSKNISDCNIICIGRTKIAKEISIKVKDHDNPKGRIEEPMEIDHIRLKENVSYVTRGNIWQNTVHLDQLMQ